jgi:hypothetical protein
MGASRFTLSLLVVVLTGASLSGQSTFGNIVGVVRDQSESVVPGAQLTLTNVDDHSERHAASGADGGFELSNLKPGRYELLVKMQRFVDFKMPALQLDARQTVRLDVTLKVASASEVVEVTAAAPVVNTENGTLGDTKDFKQITQLPVNYRGATTSPLLAIVAVPGTQSDANGNVSIGGALPSQVQYSVDGASTVNIRQNGALGNMNPSSELISEFKVTEFNNNAEFAQLGDVTITTKSGTGHYHGSLFEYMQNSVLDANTFGFDTKPHKAFNTFGGSFGGPLEIPGKKHGTPHTFFFADYEGNRRRTATPQEFLVPTQDMRAGDLSGLTSTPIIDPQTGLPFAGNRIPTTRISSVATNLLRLYIPAAHSTTNPNFNLSRQVSTPSNTDGYDIRIDRTLTDKQSIYGRWSWKNVNGTVPNVLLPSEQDHENDKNLIFSHNYLITSSLVNEARFGLSSFRVNVGFPIRGADAVAQLGLTGLDLSDHPNVNAFPAFDFSDGTGFTPLGRDVTGTTQSETIQFADNLTWRKGKHTMKFGFDLRHVAYVDLESFGGSDDFGAFTFSSGTFTGNAFADFLLGLPSKSYIAQSGPIVHAHTWQSGVYGQDEWRMTDRLTLSFGLRWQALPPFVSDLNNLTAFDPRNAGIIIPDGNQPRPAFLQSINACPGVNPALPCGPVEQAGALGLGGGVRQFYKNNFQPRLGFAYRPFRNNSTVIRGGFGIFTMTNLGQLSFNTTNIDVAVVRTTLNQLPNGQPSFQFPAVRTPDNPLTIAGTGDFYQNVDTHYRDPQSAQWNLTVERELMRNTALRVSYVGMNSYRMSETVDLNQVQPSTSPFNPNLRPYLNWGRILSTENAGNVNYNALQSEINHRTGGGLTLQASHVWAKSLGNVGGDAPSAFTPEVIYGTPVADRFNLQANRGNISQTRKQRVLVSAIYELPVGEKRKFFKSMGAIPEAIFGGWSLSTISMWETGPYLTPITSPSVDPANLNLVFRGAALRPDCVGNGNLANPTANNYFDINAFANPPANSGRLGNCGVGILRGPGTLAIAAGLAKSFQVNERVHIKFESTFTNLPNHPNFAPPPTDISSPATFGKTTTVQSAENSGNRTGQVALRVEF